MGLEVLNQSCRVTLHSYSQYVVEGIENGSKRWRGNGWMRNKREQACQDPEPMGEAPLSTSDQCIREQRSTTLLPSLRAAITTSTAAFSFSRPALT